MTQQHTVKTIYRCKHCKVEVVGRFDFRAILGRTHGKRCPRRRTLG